MIKKLIADPYLALIVVDQQIDFEPGGALAVSGGDEIVRPIADLMRSFSNVIVTQDSHPADHISFASSYQGKKPFDVLTLEEVESDRVRGIYSKEDLIRYLSKIPGHQQVLWPDHCVTGSKGWFLDPQLPLERASLILRKGTRKDCDSYSAFRENDGSSTGLGSYLRDRGMGKVFVVGLAGDYCVYWSAEDAKREGFDVYYSPDFTRYVNFPDGSRANALKNLQEKGVHFISA